MEAASLALPFEPFPKIARLSRQCIVSEKIDGTNAAVVVLPDGTIYAQSRKRVITPEDDNYGFARWVQEHRAELREQLGEGRHFGEWWGSGINRNYGLNEKRFSLFNLHRWHGSPTDGWKCIEAPLCYVVPTLATLDEFDSYLVGRELNKLRDFGSQAAPGFMNPEGLVVFHTQAGVLFKKTLVKDDAGKSFGA